jgi:hypothetical protein
LGGVCNTLDSCGDGCDVCQCLNNKWVCSMPACNFVCPSTAPREGDLCGGCCGPVPCPYPCADGGAGSMVVWTCVHEFGSSVEGTWHKSACMPAP